MVVEDKQTQLGDKLTRLWIETEEMVSRWQSKIKWLVEGDVGLYPQDSNEKVHDSDGHLVNVRTFENDDDLDNYYHTLELELDDWNEKVNLWLSNVPPRFRKHFDEVFAGGECFSKHFKEQYSYTGNVPMLLKLYDDFYKKRAALKDMWEKFGLDGWSIKEDDDVAFELIYEKVGVDSILCIKHASDIYQVHHFQDDSDFKSALATALNKSNKTHRVETSASKLQSSISKLKIPPTLRKLMIKTSKRAVVVNPRLTYGDLRRANLDDVEIVGELNSSLKKLELA